jgi:hypothetical protein
VGRGTWAAVAVLVLGACKLDLTGAACTDDDNCPVNQYCSILADQELGACVAGVNPVDAGTDFVIQHDRSLLLPLGGTAEAWALLVPAEGGVDAGQEVGLPLAQWGADNPSIVSISPATDGGSRIELLALATGQTNLTATYRVTVHKTLFASVSVVVSNAQLQSMVVTPDRPLYAPGTVGASAATGFFSDGTHADLTSLVEWSSDTPAVVAVSNASGNWGRLTAAAQGTASISASYQDLEASSIVGVSTAKLLSLSLAPVVARGVVNGQLQLEATGLFSDGTVQPMTRSVQWSLDDPQFGYFGAGGSGSVTLLAAGLAEVQAVSGATRAREPLEIGPANPVQLEISPWWPDPLGLGTSLQLQAWATTDDGIISTAAPAWSSSTPSVVISASGLLQGGNGAVPGLDGGVGTVLARASGLEASASAEVTGAPSVSLNIWPPQPVVPLGLEVPLQLERGYADGTIQDMSVLAGWRASDAGAVDVDTGDRGGTVRARQPGSATLQALLPGRTVSVEVRTPEGNPTLLEIVPPILAVPRGNRAHLAAVAHWPDGTLVEVTSAAAWTPLPQGLAVAGNGPAAGTLLGLDAGVVRVQAAFGGAMAEAAVTFEPDAGTLELWPSAPNLAIGTALPIAVTLLSASGDSSDVTQDVVWTSSDPALALVTNAPGSTPQLVGRDAGQVQLLGRVDGLELRTSAGVTGAGLASLEVQGPSTLVTWAPTAFRAVGHFTDGSLQDLTRWVSWSSSRPGHLRMLGTGPQRGVAVGLLPGAVEVRLRPRGGTMVPGSVQVDGSELSSLTIQASPVVAGTQEQVHATGHAADGATADVTGTVEWSSSDPAVATVSSLIRPGWLKALAPGTVVLQARLGTITGGTPLTVSGRALASLAISAPALLALGQTGMASAVATLTGGGGTQTISEDVVWSSDDPAVVAVSNARGGRGTLLGLAPGTVTLTARARVQGSPALVATANVKVQGAGAGSGRSPQSYRR